LVGTRKTAPAQKEGKGASRDLRGIACDTAHDLNAVAAELGYTFESAKRTLERNAAKAASDTLAGAKGKLQIEAAIKAAQTEAVTLGDSTLFGRLHRYAEMRKTIVLPEAGLTLEQARTAALLSTTYGNAQNRLQTLGLKTLPQDHLVAHARRLGAAFYRQARKKPARSNEAMRKTAAGAKGKLQIEAAIKAAQTEAVASGDSTLFGQLYRYAEMRKTIALPEAGLTLEQARAAALLSSTYRSAQDRLQSLGLKLLPQDRLAADARRLAAVFYRQARKKPAPDRSVPRSKGSGADVS
jgi:hypothetical protein